jgi:hypothetical protein
LSRGEGNKTDSGDSSLWDQYVADWEEHFSREEFDWPGDEWGSSKLWEVVHRKMFVPAGVNDWHRAVEIGPGSGKYTLQALRNPELTVRAYDVSRSFLEVCEERCETAITEGRLSLHLLEAQHPYEMVSDLTAAGWRGEVDAFFSIDAMVHVDLQDLIVYLITAALTLKPGGKLLMTLSNATSDLGFKMLLKDIVKCYGQSAGPYGRFRWLSPQISETILPRLGFRVDFASTVPRDTHLTATLTDPDVARHFEKFLLAPGEREAHRVRQGAAAPSGSTPGGGAPSDPSEDGPA